MIRAWKNIIRPLADAINARVILEIGSEIGLSTQVLLNYVREVDGHLHAIDPHPGFNVLDYERANEGFLTFYQELSLEALQRVPPVDLALVDGDHNWYTVFHELLALEQNNADNLADMPLIVAHDTGWPYGRRDLYYDPSTIPKEYRQPYAQEGIVFGKSKLVGNKGLNQNMFNAREEGGPRNGVLTGIEDFLIESSIDWHTLHLPLYFGLTILSPRQKLTAFPALERQLQHLESQLVGKELIEFGEQLRVAEFIAFQKIHRELQVAKQRVEELEAVLTDRDGLEGSV